MANNKTKADALHDLMPKHFRTKINPNWKAIVDAIGENDQEIADLIEVVRKQFFMKTAERPYLDRLGANANVSRPALVGMDDNGFRRYVPILAYQPKQVKLVIDKLLELFFFQESTTAFLKAAGVAPYALMDGWELDYWVDDYYQERILFSSGDFVDIGAATAEEITSAINRQAQYSFAVTQWDAATNSNLVRIFTKTVGAKGSLRPVGGRANIALKFQGFNTAASNGTSTVWEITKIGDTVTFTYTSGTTPSLSGVQVGDVALIEIPDNEGSFPVTAVDPVGLTFTVTNAFATAMTHNHGTVPGTTFVRFLRPEKTVVWTNKTRAIAWEVSPGEIVIEVPASPPAVRREIAGAAHFNGLVSSVTNTVSTTSLELEDASDWPLNGGYFVLQPRHELQSHILTEVDDEITVLNAESRFQRREHTYAYTGRSGNTLTGISPTLPTVAGIYELAISTAVRDVNHTVTVTTSSPHSLAIGENVQVRDTTGSLGTPVDGRFVVAATPSPNTFTYQSFGDAGSTTGGTACVERLQMANSGSIVYLTTAPTETGIFGPYMWNLAAPFVLSSLTTTLTEPIGAGDAMREIVVAPNNIPSEDGYLFFDFGTNNEEGPVRYSYKPSVETLSIDPAYIFSKNHAAGSAVTMIRRRGGHLMSGTAKEYPMYVTDPSYARTVLQELILQVKSVGVFLNFIVRYPAQYYATEDVYNVGVDPG